MKKIFSFFAALLLAGSMMAQTNLFDASTTTFESWFGDGGWGQIFTSTATWDNESGTITCTLNQAPFGQWHAQLKLQTTGIVLDATKNYEFKATFTSSVAAGGITAKLFDNSELSMKGDIAVEANVPFDYTSAAFKGGDTGNGIIAFDLGNCPDGAVVTINNIVLQESQQQVIEDPKPEAAPAAPTADAATVLSVYSNTYSAAATFGFLEAWGQSTSLEELNFDGNNVLYYKNFNWLGWGTGSPIDASTCTGLHLDIWAAAAGSIRVIPIYGGAGLTTDDSHGKVVNLAEGWNSVDLNLATDFAGLNLESIFQFKFDQNVGGNIFAFDNVYFTGYTAPTVTYVGLSELANHVGDTITLKDFEVTFAPAADTRYYYIKDKTTSSVIYYAAKNYGLVAGDKVAKGLQAKVDNYKGLLELVPVTAKADLTITPGNAPAPENAMAAPTVADQSKYVIYKNVKVVADTAFVSSAKNTVYGIMGNDTIMFYNSFKIAATLEAGKKYDIVAVNSVYNTPQVLPISVAEHQGLVDECAGEHGLYDAAAATINSTFFATVNWASNPGCYAEISNGVISVHVDQYFADMWQGQVFVDPGFSFTPGKMYHYEFDVVSTGKVGICVKVNDNDDDAFYKEEIYDFNIGGGTFHFSTDSVIATDKLAQTGKGPLVFGFGWTDGDQDVIIKCIKITEIGDAPDPVEKHMYIKHPWGTGADADWAWQEMSETKYNAMEAYTYTGAWGGLGFNIAKTADGADAKWFAADVIQFLDATKRSVVSAPAVGTVDCEFIYIPVLDNGGVVPCAVVLVPAQTALHSAAEKVAATKVIENGRVYFIKNGVRYNALGARF